MAEKDWYVLVQSSLAEQVSRVVNNYTLQDSATKGFSEWVKAAVPVGRDILFSFVRRRPDIVGYVSREYSKDPNNS